MATVSSLTAGLGPRVRGVRQRARRVSGGGWWGTRRERRRIARKIRNVLRVKPRGRVRRYRSTWRGRARRRRRAAGARRSARRSAERPVGPR
jgi:hypothetical protein